MPIATSCARLFNAPPSCRTKNTGASGWHLKSGLLTVQAHNPEQEEAEDQVEVKLRGRGSGDRLQRELPAGCARRARRQDRGDRAVGCQQQLSGASSGVDGYQVRRDADAAVRRSVSRVPRGTGRMSLGQLSIQNLRCLRQVELDLHPGRNLIVGANGSGKTSLLEAIFLLGRGRSFRTRNSERLITHGGIAAGGLRPHLACRHPAAPTALGVQVTRGEPTVAKIQGEFARTLADLSQVLAGSGHRSRRAQAGGGQRLPPSTLDGLGDVPRGTWVRGGLGQLHPRAQAAKCRAQAGCDPWARRRPQLAAWDVELAQLGERLAQLAGETCSRPAAALAGDRCWPWPGLNLELVYFQGWARDSSLMQALAAVHASATWPAAAPRPAPTAAMCC